MDSTLIEGEVIDELAKLAGVADEVMKMTESAMRGEIEFEQSFRRRVSLLRGLPEGRVHELLNTIPLVQGAKQLIGTLKTLGHKTAILSGGFNFFAQHLQRRLGIDYVFANDLDIADGLVTGELRRRQQTARARHSAAKDCRSGKYFPRSGGRGWRCANDLPMLVICRAMGLSFQVKRMVRQTASHAVAPVWDWIACSIG